MKRLLGGVRHTWAGAATTKKLIGVAGILTAALFLMAIGPARPAAAAPDPANIPTSFKWLNRYYIVDDKGNNYFDSDTYDNKYEYEEQGNWPCKNRIVFTYTGGGSMDDTTNQNFFYRLGNANGVSTAPNPVWGFKVALGGQVTDPSGQTPCTWTDQTGIPISNNDNAQRATFYTNDQDQVISILSGVKFSRKGEFQGSARYFRDDEVTDQANSCPDMIIKHAGDPAAPGDQLFGSGAVAGSAMLYSVEKNTNLGDTSESYSWISGSQSIGPGTCHVKADAINKRTGGVYGLTAAGGDDKFRVSGLDRNGNITTSGSEYDDAFIIFIGSLANMPKDANGAPIQTPVNNGSGTEGDKNDQNACKAGALGWLICPIIDTIQKATQWLQDGMQALLTVNPLPIGSGGIYDAWNNIRNLANVAFVIAFFAIIFSQATSIGISNYGIKRLLPRLILIAVATNISYFVCSVLIDIFNVLGVGIVSLFGAVNNGNATGVDVNTASGAIFVSGLALGLAWAISTGAIVQVFPLLAAAFLALLVTFILLVLRQMIIILLVVVSPVAFVAALLPGTQGFFRRWFDLFSTLLMMYPLIMAMFAAMNLASAILSAAQGG